MIEVKSSVFLVQFSQFEQHKSGNGGWNRNYDLMVVAETLEAAIEGVRQQYPDAVLHAVNRKGTQRTLLVIDSEPSASATRPSVDTTEGDG